MNAHFLPEPAGARRIYLIVGFLILLAWCLLVVWQQSAYAELLGHEAIEDDRISMAGHVAAFLLSWLLMTVAMMLPASLPMLIHSTRPVGDRMMDLRTIGPVLLGYLLPWGVFGLLAYLGDGRLHELAEHSGPLEGLAAWIAPAIVLGAGLYQLTPLKRRYLRLCQAPQPLNLPRLAEGVGGPGALVRGLRLGGYCMGSCWPLMLMMFALGHHRLDWMLALAVLLAAERLTPWGERLARWVGVALIVWAPVWVLAA